MRGATQSVSPSGADSLFQSTRPMRGATTVICYLIGQAVFQSTRPMRGATMSKKEFAESINISIHAPHAGRDTAVAVGGIIPLDFNPRAPCGARLRRVSQEDQHGKISIHAPHAGRDPYRFLDFSHLSYFNPRAPCGARPTAAATPSPH